MKNKLYILTLILIFISGRMCVGQTAYITNYSSNTVSVIDVTTNIVTSTIPVASGPGAISVSADGSRVYITHRFLNIVSVINTATDTVIATIPVGINPWNISVSPDGSKVYVSHYTFGTVRVINTATNTVTDTIAAGIYPDALCVTPDGNWVYVADYSGGHVNVVNTVTNLVTASVFVGPMLAGICVSPNGGYVYVASYTSSSTVGVINTATNTVSATITVGAFPSGVCINPNGSKVYVSNSGSNSVSVINTVNNTVSATISVGGQPGSISCSPDGTKVYVVMGGGANSVKVINTATNSVSATIAVGTGPQAWGNFISIFGTITIDSIATSVCAGSNLSVPFTGWDTLNNGNVFTAQLSDASGSFANPINIGTLIDTIAGSISAIIPANTPAGTGYRIRVVSSNPVATGADNGSNITINPTYSQTVSASICQGSTYTFPDGTTDTMATVHTSHFSTVNTCDSSIVTTLTINPTYTQTVSASICNGSTYTFPDGSTDTMATVHTSLLSSINGCDSSITTHLSVITPNVGIYILIPVCGCPSTLVVDSLATSYQWIDCYNGDSIIAGETNSDYWIIHDGSYAVIINLNGCIDTSDCFYAVAQGISNLNDNADISIFPNPFTNQFTVTSEQLTVKEIKVYNLIGEEVLQSTIDNHQSTIDMSGYAKGIYFVEIKTEQGIVRKKIVKQ